MRSVMTNPSHKPRIVVIGGGGGGGAGGLALVNRSNNTLGRKVRDVPSGFSSGRV
jgi:hypothetical protein